MLERYGIVGRIVAALFGLAWNLVTFLTMPILVIEDVGVGDAFRRSKDLFRKTWGENVVGQAGLGVLGFLVVIPAIVLFAVGAALGTAGLVVLGAIGVVWIAVDGDRARGVERDLPHRAVPLRRQPARCRPTSPAPTSRARSGPRDDGGNWFGGGFGRG